MVRRMDRQGEVLIWCRECCAYGRQRMGPKLMNHCKLEKVGTKGHGQMLRRIQVLEEGRFPAKEAREWKLKDEKEGLQEEKGENWMSLRLEASWLEEDYGIFAKEKIKRQRSLTSRWQSVAGISGYA